MISSASGMALVVKGVLRPARHRSTHPWVARLQRDLLAAVMVHPALPLTKVEHVVRERPHGADALGDDEQVQVAVADTDVAHFGQVDA